MSCSCVEVSRRPRAAAVDATGQYGAPQVGRRGPGSPSGPTAPAVYCQPSPQWNGSVLLRPRPAVPLLALAALCFMPTRGAGQALTRDQAEARAVFAELIGINTTHSHGSTTVAARAVARRFVTAGFPARDVVVAGPTPTRQNLVVRLRAVGRAPAHPAAGPSGRGRGAPGGLVARSVHADRAGRLLLRAGNQRHQGHGGDLRADAAPLQAGEGARSTAIVILALTADEEGGENNGVQWLLAHRRPLIDAAYAINGDGGDPLSRDGQVYARNVQASEKVYIDIQLEIHHPGGHSSQPVRENAIVPALGRHRAARHAGISAAAQRGDAGLLPPRGGGDARRRRRAHADGGGVGRHDRHATPLGQLGILQRAAANHLRADPHRRRARRERAAADRHRQRELPDAAGRAAGGRAGGDPASGGGYAASW